MANNYSQATMEPTCVYLSDEQIAYLSASGAAFDPNEAEKSALEQLAEATTDKKPLRGYYVYWEEWYQEYIEEEDLEDRLVDDYSAEQIKEIWAHYKDLSFEGILREVLMNPENKDIDYIAIEGANTCSKLRPGNFGGFVTVVTRQEYFGLGTGAWDIKDGRIVPRQVAVHQFDEAPTPTRV